MPDEVRNSLDLPRGEQVLAAAVDADDAWVVATDAALVVDGHRVEWATVARAGWDDDASVLTVETMATPDRPAEVLRPALPDPGLLPETVRERVESSIVASRRVTVRRGASVRVVARAVPRSDELLWQVILDRGLDPADPEVTAVADEVTAQLRRELGA